MNPIIVDTQDETLSILQDMCNQIHKTIQKILKLKFNDPNFNNDESTTCELFLTVFANCYVNNLLNIMDFSSGTRKLFISFLDRHGLIN